MTVNIEHWRIAVRTYGKSVIFIKSAQLYSYYCESHLYSLLSLACVIPLYLYYALLGQTLNLLSFLTKSNINNLTKFCLSLQLAWILEQNTFLSVTGT